MSRPKENDLKNAIEAAFKDAASAVFNAVVENKSSEPATPSVSCTVNNFIFKSVLIVQYFRIAYDIGT